MYGSRFLIIWQFHLTRLISDPIVEIEIVNWLRHSDLLQTLSNQEIWELPIYAIWLENLFNISDAIVGAPKHAFWEAELKILQKS